MNYVDEVRHTRGYTASDGSFCIWSNDAPMQDIKINKGDIPDGIIVYVGDFRILPTDATIVVEENPDLQELSWLSLLSRPGIGNTFRTKSREMVVSLFNMLSRNNLEDSICLIRKCGCCGNVKDTRYSTEELRFAIQNGDEIR